MHDSLIVVKIVVDLDYTGPWQGMIGKMRQALQDPDPPRGILRPSFSQGQFEHHRQLPSAPLAAWVEHYWHVRWDLRGLPAQQQATLPHPNVHLVVEQGCARIWGVHHGRFVRQLQGLDQVFGIKFKAGGFYPFYGQPVAGLLNRSLDVVDCFGPAGADLTRHVLAAADFEAICAAAEALLLQQMPAPDPHVPRVSSLLARIARDMSIVSVEDVLAVSGLNRRGLQRLFQ
jgi:hypothetical protein